MKHRIMWNQFKVTTKWQTFRFVLDLENQRPIGGLKMSP